MQARDLMTTKVLAVGPDEPTRKIAQLLLDHGISAVPVVDAECTPIGMVSEGDLIGRGGNSGRSAGGHAPAISQPIVH